MSTSICFDVPEIHAEFEGLHLGDRRLNRRAVRVASSWAERPSDSLPQAMGSVAALEGAYRLLNNPRVTGDKVLKPHLDACWGRASESDWVLSVEDTSEMRFGGELERHGLGELMNGGQGFHLHLSLVLRPEGGFFLPVGVGAHELLVRERGRAKKHWKQRVKDPDRESMRWHRVSDEAAARGKEVGVKVIHVCDREADDYAWMESVLDRNGHFVVRNAYNRRTGKRTHSQDSQTYLWDQVQGETPVLATREVSFQARTKSGGRKRKDPRSKRTTTLEIRAAEVELLRPDTTAAHAKSLKMNLVAVTEAVGPKDDEPVAWLLLTTEPVATAQDVLRVVDAYRARWVVEELFKALKTGCNYERLQLESLHALHNALALCLPMAWRMLALRTYARDLPDAPAEVALEPAYLRALKLIASKPKNRWGLKMKRSPTAGEALFAVARLGGHLKRNGAPGWLTLSRGFKELDKILDVAALLEGREM